MEAVGKRPQVDGLKQFLSTRRGAYTIAAVAAGLAALVLVIFISEYRESVDKGLAPTPVLTADRLIPRGTAGATVVSERLFKPAALAEEDLKVGAVTDVRAIAGKVAVREILPGEQITAADFAAQGDPIRSRLQKTERAVQIPIDRIHGLLGTVRPGDRVDILAAFNATGTTGSGTPSLRPVLRDVRIMAAPGYSANIGGGSVILQLTDVDAARIAFASDNGKLWFLLRPPVGARNSKDVTVSQESLLSGGGVSQREAR